MLLIQRVLRILFGIWGVLGRFVEKGEGEVTWMSSRSVIRLKPV